MTHGCICKTCDKKFKSQKKDSAICYDCALAELIGNGGPEEGDINTALIRSGEMSDESAGWLQEDLESVDHSREESLQNRIYEEYYDDHRWDYLEERDEDE